MATKAKKAKKAKTAAKKTYVAPASWEGSYTIKYADADDVEPVIMDGVKRNKITLKKIPDALSIGGVDSYLCEVNDKRKGQHGHWEGVVFVSMGFEPLKNVAFLDDDGVKIGPDFPSRTFVQKENRQSLTNELKLNFISTTTERLLGATLVYHPATNVPKVEYIGLYRITGRLKSGSKRKDVIVVRLYDPVVAQSGPHQTGWGNGTRP